MDPISRWLFRFLDGPQSDPGCDAVGDTLEEEASHDAEAPDPSTGQGSPTVSTTPLDLGQPVILPGLFSVALTIPDSSTGSDLAARIVVEPTPAEALGDGPDCSEEVDGVCSGEQHIAPAPSEAMGPYTPSQSSLLVSGIEALGLRAPSVTSSELVYPAGIGLRTNTQRAQHLEPQLGFTELANCSSSSLGTVNGPDEGAKRPIRPHSRAPSPEAGRHQARAKSPAGKTVLVSFPSENSSVQSAAGDVPCIYAVHLEQLCDAVVSADSRLSRKDFVLILVPRLRRRRGELICYHKGIVRHLLAAQRVFKAQIEPCIALRASLRNLLDLDDAPNPEFTSSFKQWFSYFSPTFHQASSALIAEIGALKTAHRKYALADSAFDINATPKGGLFWKNRDRAHDIDQRSLADDLFGRVIGLQGEHQMLGELLTVIDTHVGALEVLCGDGKPIGYYMVSKRLGTLAKEMEALHKNLLYLPKRVDAFRSQMAA